MKGSYPRFAARNLTVGRRPGSGRAAMRPNLGHSECAHSIPKGAIRSAKSRVASGLLQPRPVAAIGTSMHVHLYRRFTEARPATESIGRIMPYNWTRIPERLGKRADAGVFDRLEEFLRNTSASHFEWPMR